MGEALPWLLVMTLVVATAGLPFFWDTLQLASRHAHFFYEHGFSSLFLPNDMDSGHIPAFGMYLALIWLVFGKTMLVSHLAMAPFIVTTLFFTRRLAGRLFPGRYAWLATLVLIADATLLAQFTLVSPDIWIACFFTMALWAFLDKKSGLQALAFTGLALTSMRGMMIVAAFFVTRAILLFFPGSAEKPDSFSSRHGSGKSPISNYIMILLRDIPFYLPAALLVILYLGFHYLRSGWIGYHPDMPWYEHFARVNFSGFLRNILIFGWRLADQGRLFFWMVGAGILTYGWRNKWKTTGDGRLLIVLSLVLTAVFSYSALTYRNLAGHRYFIPLFLMIALTVIYHLFIFVSGKKRLLLILLFLLAGELSGNFWVYPDSIAKGWDASLAYLPYQHLRREMNRFLGEKGIPPEAIGTSFPNNVAFEYIDLSEDNRSFGTAGEEGREFDYLLWSNVFNDFPEELKETAEQGWRVVRELRLVQVRMVLYENPAITRNSATRPDTP